jgi:hypothetical protein
LYCLDIVQSTPPLKRRNSLEEIRQRAAQERAQYQQQQQQQQQQRTGYVDPLNPKEFTSDDVSILFNFINNALAGKFERCLSKENSFTW